jgi:hypothetical protein
MTSKTAGPGVSDRMNSVTAKTRNNFSDIHVFDQSLMILPEQRPGQAD